MIATLLAATLLLAIVATAAIRGSRRRTAELEATLHAALARHLGRELDISDGYLSLEGDGYRLSRPRLLAVARRTGLEEAVEAATELLRRPLRPLTGTLSLKLHGTRVGLHFVDPAVLDLMPPEPRLARRLVSGLGLAATYRIDGRADQCVTEDHLREQTIDTTDLHGIALAVQRQSFDEDLLRRVTTGTREVIESQDGSAGALVLLAPDFLPPRARICATLEGANRLTLEAWGEGAISSAKEGLALEIDHQGWRVR